MTHRKATLERWDRLAAAALRIIDDEATSDTTLTDIARRLNVSARLLQQALAQRGTRYTTEIYRAQMARAGQRMVEGKRVDATAREVGYHSPSAFCVAFKRCYGLEPSEFRFAAHLYQRLKWRTEFEPPESVSHGSREYYSRRYRIREDQKQLASLLRSLTRPGHELLRRYGRPLNPRRRGLAAPWVVRRRYASASGPRGPGAPTQDDFVRNLAHATATQVRHSSRNA